jgi:branched-chain amino acid transport system permease protein
MMNVRVAAFGKLKRLLLPYLALFLAALPAVAGGAAIIEMIYQIQLNAGSGSKLRFLGVDLDTDSVASWLGAAVVLVVGVALLEMVRRRFVRVWGQVQEEIEADIKRREATQ